MDIFDDELIDSLPWGNYGRNVCLMPRVVWPMVDEYVDKFNHIVDVCTEAGLDNLLLTPAKHISKKNEDVEAIAVGPGGANRFRIILSTTEGNVCIWLTPNTHEFGKKKPMTGSRGYRLLAKELAKDNVLLPNYAEPNGEKIKETIQKPLIDVDEDILGYTIQGANHLDFHSAYPGALAECYPEMRPTIERIFKQRKENPELKIALDSAIGFFQSEYCKVMDYGPYSLARLAQKALNRNRQKMEELTERMKHRGYKILAHNTDGIWYTGGVYHGRGEGPNVGEWENDHIDTTIRFKSRGAYEYIENGIYHPVVRGKTRLDDKKPRDQWEWGDIFNYGFIYKYAFNPETRKVEKIRLVESELDFISGLEDEEDEGGLE